MSEQESIALPNPPADFDQFWERTLWSQSALALDIERTHDPADDTPTHTVDRLSFTGGYNRRIHGWFAVPKEKPASGLGGLLWLPVYGFNALQIGHYSTLPGFCTLSINVLGHSADFSEQYNPRTGEGGYMARDIYTREAYIYREIAVTAVRALDALSLQPEVDAGKLIAGGMSQGGGLSLWLAALISKLKAVFADMPFFSHHGSYLGRAFPRYPYKEIYDAIERKPGSEEEVRRTLSYFDTLNFAEKARCPVQVSYGTKDPSVRPPGVQALYNALPHPKNLLVYERGHEWVEEMPENNLRWVRRFIPE